MDGAIDFARNRAEAFMANAKATQGQTTIPSSLPL